MPAYHQMGHDSENLLKFSSQFRGAILSPVNETTANAARMVKEHGGDSFEFVFDPQLYFPKRIDKGQLSNWDYFPKDFDTADMSTHWWKGVIGRVADTAKGLKVGAVCSPAIIPKRYDNRYYEEMRAHANALATAAGKSGPRALMTVIASLSELADTTRVQEISSIVSATKATGVYLIFMSDVPPRRELKEVEEIKGGMRLIHALERAGMPVLVGCSSHDLILWKTAGATSCATGKFSNLRRFSASRFNDSDEGGRQMAYWFEESLLAFIRTSDLERIQEAGLSMTPPNVEGKEILSRLRKDPTKAWVGEGWRQYMRAFANLEARLTQGEKAREIIRAAEKNWDFLEEKQVFMEERPNDGSWTRPWLRAVVEFNK